MQFYVKTGPSFHDTFCQRDRAVKVEFLLKGHLRAPFFQDHIVSLDYRGHSLYAVDVVCLLNSKLTSFTERGVVRDYNDIKYLVRVRGPLIQSQKSGLNEDYVENFIQTMQSSIHEDAAAVQYARAVLVYP